MTDQRSPLSQRYHDLFQTSMDQKRGLTVFFNGQQIPGVVTEISDQVIMMRSQQYSQILVRIDQIDALAIS